jgi:ribosomal protein S18 acetylase RimI-like enzyme
MMAAPALSLDTSPDGDDIAVIARGMREHALAQIAGDESPPIACFARDGRVIVGGAVGRIIKGRLFVELLWVEEAWRDGGLGSSLLNAIEEHARERGCADALLETLSTSAARLYTSAGYRLQAEIPDYIPGFAKRVFVKTLA